LPIAWKINRSSWRSLLGILLLLAALAVWSLVAIRHQMHSAFFHPRYGSEYPQLTPQALGLPFESVSFSCPGGPELVGYWIPQPNAREAIVFLHGNAGSMRTPTRMEVVKFFHDLGYPVLTFDYRGYGDSKGRPNHRGVMEDARAAVSFAAGRPGIDRVGLYGHSLGGSLALCLEDASPEIGAVVSEGAFPSAAGMVRLFASDLLPPGVASLLTRWLFRSPIEPLDCLARRPPTTPTLLIHGEDDEVIPASMADELAALFPEGNGELRLVPGKGHQEPLAITSEREHVAAFLAQALESEPAAEGPPSSPSGGPEER
jgi:pimeloyl-ACP methyl ester carboxylesterase